MMFTIRMVTPNESGALEIQKIQDSILERCEKLRSDIEKGEELKLKKGLTDTGLKYRWVVMLKGELDYLGKLDSELEQVRVSEFGY